MKKNIIKKAKAIFRIPNIVYVLSAGFLVRMMLSSFGTLQLDQGTFIAWAANLAKDGFDVFYNSWSDYLPGYLYVLWGLGKINLLNLIEPTILFKLPAILVDIVTGYLIYEIVKKQKGEKIGLIGAMFYIFNPAILYNSALWGQVDSFTALFSLLAIYLLPINYQLSAVSLAVGTVIKPQAAFLMPLILVLFWKNKYKFSKLLTYCLIGLFVFILAFVPFWNHGGLISFILERLTASANQYQYTAINSFNFWGLFGQWKPDTVYYQYGGYLFFLISFVLFAKKIWQTKNFEYKAGAFIFLFTFLFFTRMHERHLLPVFAPLAVISAFDFAFILPLMGLTFTYIANMRYAFVWLTQDNKNIFEQGAIDVLILISVFCLFLIYYASVNSKKMLEMLKQIKMFFEKGRRNVKGLAYKKSKITSKKTKLILVSILVFAFATRVYKISQPESDYFDEIYHAFTARIVLHNDPKAWEWWNPHPEGFAYEWTHPPLSKLAMAGSMKILGENSFGWRFPQAIFGTASIYILYLLTKKIFKDEVIALTSAFLFSLDGLFLVLSRMAMNDVYVLFFMLLAIYLFLKEEDMFSAISFGLAIAILKIFLSLKMLERKKKFIKLFLVQKKTRYLKSLNNLVLT